MSHSRKQRQRRLDEAVGPLGKGEVYHTLTGEPHYTVKCRSCWVDKRRLQHWSTRWRRRPGECWSYFEVLEAWDHHLHTEHLSDVLADSGYTGVL